MSSAPTVLPLEQAWSLLSPEEEARVEAARWIQQARSFFRAALTVSPVPGALTHLVIGVAPLPPGAPATLTHIVTMPLLDAPQMREAGQAGARAIGGAGFDVLVTRARRLWQVDAHVPEGADARAPLVVAGVLASVLLAPILPPGGGTIFGVKGARVRLEAAGWRT